MVMELKWAINPDLHHIHSSGIFTNKKLMYVRSWSEYMKPQYNFVVANALMASSGNYCIHKLLLAWELCGCWWSLRPMIFYYQNHSCVPETNGMFKLVDLVSHQKAFDTVANYILLWNLQKYGIPGIALDRINSYLARRNSMFNLGHTFRTFGFDIWSTLGLQIGATPFHHLYKWNVKRFWFICSIIVCGWLQCIYVWNRRYLP